MLEKLSDDCLTKMILPKDVIKAQIWLHQILVSKETTIKLTAKG